MKATALTRRILHGACRIDGPRSLLEEFPGRIDWNDLVDRASILGMISPVNQLVRERIPAAPTSLEQRLGELQLRQAADAVTVHQQLSDALTALRGAGIEVIVLKGAALAWGVYQNVAARPMRDLDLLIRPEQLFAAEAILMAQGYRPDELYHPKEWWIEHHHHLIPLVCEGRPVPIELHRDIVPPDSGIVTDVPGLWSRARPASIAGVHALVLSHNDLLLHLCQHLDRLVGRLGTLRDIAAVVAQETPIDWPWLVSAAAQSRSAARTYCALRLARSVAGARIPGKALASLRRIAKFTVVEDLCLGMIAERALTWTEDGGRETAWLFECGAALLGGTGIVNRSSAALRSLSDRVATSVRRPRRPAQGEVTRL